MADLPAGSGIGYGPSFTTTRLSRIATLPLGYADGYPRALSNRAQALVRGRRVPLVGNVAMDALMVDVTDVPGPPVDLDDEFVLIGSQGSRDDPARRAGATAHHQHARNGHGHVPPLAPGVPCRGGTGGGPDHRDVEGSVSRIQLWNGDICELEVDAIVNPANPSLWMSTGVGQALKATAGEEVEFAAVRQAPVSIGDAIVTPAGRLAARLVIHAVSLDRDRRTSAHAIETAVRNVFARAREHGVTSLALPALGTGVGRFPLDDAARIAVRTVRDELRRSPDVGAVTFAVRGVDAYAAFERALAAPVGLDIVAEPAPSLGGLSSLRGALR